MLKVTISRMGPQGPESHARAVPHLSAAMEFVRHVAKEAGWKGRSYATDASADEQTVGYLVGRGYYICINQGV